MILRTLILSFFIFFSNHYLKGQIFPCDGSFYIIQNSDEPGTPSAIYRLYNSIDGIDIVLMATTDYTFNAAGYNPIDHFVYAVSKPGNDIYQIRSDGSVNSVFEEPTLNWFVTGAGDIRMPDTTYIVHNRPTHSLYFYRLTNPVQKVAQVELVWDSSVGLSGIPNLHLDDLATDPTEPGSAYTYQRNYVAFGPEETRGHLLRIDIDYKSPTFGHVFIVGPVSALNSLHLGAMFFDNNGQLYGYGSTVFPIIQNTLISIDKNSGFSEKIGIGPAGKGTDGCMCPFYIDLLSEVKSESFCDSAIVEFNYRITNNAIEPISNITFTDTLPDGFSILNVDPGDGAMGASLVIDYDHSIIQLSNGMLLEGEEVEFKIIAVTKNPGTFNNQASISGLPEKYGSRINSDDPLTIEFDDANEFQISFLSPALLDYEDDYKIDIGDSVALQIFSSIPLSQITWIPDSSLSCNNCNPVWASPSVPTEYTFYAVDENGCLHEGEIRVRLGEIESSLFIPNVFSPGNGDNANDYFTVFGKNLVQVSEMSIFDRWGDLVWEGGPFLPNDPGVGWNGKFNQELMMPGVYVYKVTVQYANGAEFTLAGDITLVR